MSKRTDKEFVLDMKKACERIMKYTEGLTYEKFCGNSLVQEAEVRNIEILGEAAKNIRDEFKEKHSEIEWREISNNKRQNNSFLFWCGPFNYMGYFQN